MARPFRTLVVALIAGCSCRPGDPDCANAVTRESAPFPQCLAQHHKTFSERIAELPATPYPSISCSTFSMRPAFSPHRTVHDRASLLVGLAFTRGHQHPEFSGGEFTAGCRSRSPLASGSMQQHGSAGSSGWQCAFACAGARHQYPYYAGIFKPVLAGQLLFIGQGFRALSILAAMLFYYWLIT